ncbi:hypothetical protein OE88DRAFT_1222010 [Heliocybe sulcata]|uniref:Uncharacterized protein n=1 Tax=Heliocybe sulcata TaxID=5364 RepID=A0A5C3MIU3_9AGAM|nr:hypothetical protein OE88DRAFT_1222010 [Heliocybe sulcata]
MLASVNGIICASKLTLRRWRDVRNSSHLGYVSACQNRLSPYLPSIYNMQKRRAFLPKALVRRGKRRIPKSDIPAPAPTRLRRPLALPYRKMCSFHWCLQKLGFKCTMPTQPMGIHHSLGILGDSSTGISIMMHRL